MKPREFSLVPETAGTELGSSSLLLTNIGTQPIDSDDRRTRKYVPQYCLVCFTRRCFPLPRALPSSPSPDSPQMVILTFDNKTEQLSPERSRLHAEMLRGNCLGKRPYAKTT